MKLILSITMILAMQAAFANVHSKLDNGQLAYYGKDFYVNFPRNVTRDLLVKILGGQHSSSPKGPDVIGPCQKGLCYEHTSIGYSEARKILFGEVYGKTDSQGNYVEDVYCEKKFYFNHVDDTDEMHASVNIEHTWPQSKFAARFSKEMQKSDMHHLFLTDSDANNRRGNFPFGNVVQGDDELNVHDCHSSRLSRQGGRTVFNPPTSHLGNVARSLFYFAVRYGTEIDPAQEAVIREWHKNDPVDADEKERHEKIAAHELIRNPFVDHPEIVNSITNF
jgi:deoxyribonuclease-1